MSQLKFKSMNNYSYDQLDFLSRRLQNGHIG
jgi:hypothetical protein